VTHRRGFTLFELVVVLAIVALLAIIVIPSLGGFRGDTRLRAASDQIRGELATAVSRAKEEGRPYRVSLSDDYTRIRRAPDDLNFETVTAMNAPSGESPAVDYKFDYVTAQLVTDPTTNLPLPNAYNGWFTVATVQPDGTCREFGALIAIKEKDQTLYLRMRGLTASMRVVPAPTNQATNQSTNTGGP
jgi:type II secretion system protein H